MTPIQVSAEEIERARQERERSTVWAIMPVMGAPDLTEVAISDVLAQTVPVKLLIVLQDVDPLLRERIESIAEQEPRIFVWSHCPPLPSLSATWNRALDAVWEAGGTEAWVVNNDIRVHRDTVETLRAVMEREQAYFVTAVGVTKEQYDPISPLPPLWLSTGALKVGDVIPPLAERELLGKGGPDFSNFLIAKAGHEKYRFDEGFVPAFCEDLDTHRRYMLGGDGDKIFSINLPYLHVGGGSNTLKSMDPEARQRHEAKINRSREYYAKKWGGGVNQERYTQPFDESSAQDGVTTPDLQAKGREVVSHV